MHVVFVEPRFPYNQREFVRALSAAGARVTGIGESSPGELDGELQHWLYRYERVSNVCDEGAMRDTVARIMAREPVARLEATIEAHVMTAAHVREALGIPGTTSRTAFLCRDKPAMKEALRAAGVPCAASTGASSADEALAFAQATGYPLVVKPRDAAGASGTERVDSEAELRRALAQVPFERGAAIAIEEFIEGHEGFYDTITIDGQVQHEFISHYYPNVLDAMRTRWISPQFISTNRTDAASYDELKALGQKVIAALGIWTSATHMEWFFGPRGLKFSEIGCRPPGVRAYDLYAAGNEMDIYAEWALAVTQGRIGSRPSRRYAAGLIALRPDQDGQIAGYEGVEEMHRVYGDRVIDAHLPGPGTPTQPVAAGYMANAWVRMRHPDYDQLRRLLDHVGQTVKVHAR